MGKSFFQNTWFLMVMLKGCCGDLGEFSGDLLSGDLLGLSIQMI